MKLRINHHQQKNQIPIVCHESCMADGGRSSGDGLQEQLPNRPELHMLRACVVSVREKVFLRGDQVWVKEMNESEPLDEVSKICLFSASKPGR